MSEMRVRLSKPQGMVYRCTKRFKIVCAGRRFGKTFLAINYLIEKAQAPNTINWYIAPTYRQAKQIAWKMLKQLLPLDWVASWNETDLTAHLVNGS